MTLASEKQHRKACEENAASYSLQATLSFGVIHDTIKQRLRASLKASASGKSTLDAASALASELSEEGAWSDLDEHGDPPPDSGKSGHLGRTLLLARARHLAPHEINGPAQRALDWWLSRDFRGDDGSWNQRASSRLVGEIALLCEEELSVGAASKVVEILARSRWAEWRPGTGWVEQKGAALLGVARNSILRGCLENAPLVCETAFRRLFRSSLWTGSGGAGAGRRVTLEGASLLSAEESVYAQDYARLVALAHGTPWQASTESVRAFVSHLLDFQQWTLRRGHPDGGEMAGLLDANSDDLRGLAAALVQLSQLGNPPRRVELMALAERLVGEGKPLSGHRYFWRSRFAVHQRPSFYSSLQLDASGDIYPGTAPDHPAEAGGIIHFMRNGHEYTGLVPRGKSRDASLANGKLPALLDGVFAERQRFAGGVSDGENGMAAAETRSSSLRGKKAWFFFNDSVVCLETDVRGVVGEQPVFTTVNHCRLNGPVVIETAARQRHALGAGDAHRLTNVRRMEHDGLLYHFLGSPQLVAQIGASTDAPTANAQAAKDILNLRIDHGIQPSGATAGYAVLPVDDDPAVRRGIDAEIALIEVLSNTSTTQAVRHRGTGLLGVAFWSPGVVSLPSGGRVAANRPCLLLCREDPHGATTLSVSNPLPLAGTVHVEYGGSCLCFELPGEADAGRTLRREL